MIRDFLAAKVMDNSLRGYWCEAMVAEALGPGCKIVSQGWHPWDLQFGSDQAEFPERVRIQVKNSARLQSWHKPGGKPSDSLFNLKFSKRPSYFETDYPGIPCEEVGFMCDVFILCHHPAEDWNAADQTDPEQWEFYVLPVLGPNIAVTEAEITAARGIVADTGKPSNCQRRPSTMKQGIRGRLPIVPVGIRDLNEPAIWAALGKAACWE